MKPYEFNFRQPLGLIDVEGINGYLQALTAVYNQVKELTEFKPEKRMIDAVEILDKITATTKELEKLLEEAREEDRAMLSELSSMINP